MPELTVASFNVHAGRSARRGGWHPFDVAAACARLEADVVVLQESWAPDGGDAQHDEVAAAIGGTVSAVPLARGTVRPIPDLLGRADSGRGDGAFCIAVVSRIPVLGERARRLPQLPFDPWNRVLLEVELDIGATPLLLSATHFAHLEFGAPLQGPALRRQLPAADRPAVFMGDMNMWGWTLAAMVPKGWRRVVRGPTWPSHHPRHQIDHIAVTESVEVRWSDVPGDLGSDHLPVRARLAVP